jgi:hypothetical protein
VLYLHNDPSPPVGDTVSQPILPLDETAPAAATLYNYDTDRDSAPGIVLAKGGTGPTETDTKKYQAWHTSALSSGLTINGTVRVVLWTGIIDFDTGKVGSVTVYLRHFDGSTYRLIGVGMLTEPDWQAGSSTWVEKTIAVTVGKYTIPPGDQLDVKVLVNAGTGKKMWFAYDTTSYPSRLILP